MSNPKHLHKEVATGVIQMIKFIDGKTKFSLEDVIKIGTREKSDDAQMFICEFAKDGIVSLTEKSIQLVRNGNYSEIWDFTNQYLEKFGHKPVKPIQLRV